MGKLTYLKLFCCVWLFFISSQVCNGKHSEGCDVRRQYVNRKLSQLAELIPEVKSIEQDTIIKSRLLPKNKSLVVRFNHQYKIEHLGVSLFSEETKKMLDETVCDFLERILLELLVQESTADVKRKMVEYHIDMKYNGQNFGSGNFVSIYKLLHDLTMPVEFRLTYENKHGLATWNLKGEKSISLLFPMSAELVKGMDKKEADNQLYNRLVQMKTHTDQYLDCTVKDESLEKKNSRIYVKRGTEYLIPNLNSDVYFERKGNEFRPLYSAMYPVESLKTLFHTYYNGEKKKLCITHRQYGHFTPEIQLPLNNFLSLFKKNFEIYTSSMKQRNDHIEILVVIHHKNLNYIHLMRVRVKKEDVGAEYLVMKADFYSNIPQHYIKSLFNIKSK